ncbi:WD40-repeat-containing domain protein [Chytriomyces sp. MP71]|nr:WD40-repeat-containing domain protein [Chytriomyces sp. MP71]
MVKHYVFNQTLLISGKPNARRIASVAWHLLHGGVPSMGEAVKTLQNISYLGAAIDGDLLDEVLECYKYALENLGDTVYSAQLTEYYRFLVNNYGALSKSSRQLIPLAANLYTTSVISGDVRSWVKSRAPDLNWAEWVNRPTSRGEPIAWMKSQEPSQELTVTSRDTFGNMIVVAGIRVSDMQSSLMLFEVDYKSTAVLPEHRSRLRRVTVLDLPREEQQMPLTCSFSRSGRMIAVAARSLMFVQTSDLALVRCVEDPSLPEGDIITAIAWTKDDGCVVTASDGSEPGRIVLWDAGSFSLLRAIKSQYPRQPICTSYATMGFWDEYRDLFILLDVDELASDAESGLFLQYIPTKSHSDPPLDGCARFALAHKAPLVLVANDEGKGYTLIDFRAKKPVARAEVDIDTVRYVALSADGTKIGIVPVEGKVIHILGLAEPLDKSNASKEAPDLPLFVHMGTILGSAETEQPVCLFSRNRLTIITDGDVGSTQVWAINDLGDHSTVRYISLLPALSQGLCPVVNSSNVLGWAITENRTEVSMSDSKAKAKARTYDVVAEDTYNAPKQGLMYKDLVVAIASHPEKPFTAVVTDKGQLTLLYNDSISLDPRKWIRGLWTTKKVEDGLIASFNLCQGSPTSVVFVPTAPVAGDRNGVNLNAETLSFVTGHEDGMLFLWEWSSMLQTDEIQPMRSMKLNNGRITSLAGAHAGSHTVAATLDETTVVIWDGKSNDLGSVSVLIAPVDSNNFNRGSVSMASNHHRWSASSLWSSTGLSDYSLSRPTIVSFSSTSDKVLVTGDEGGIITIWSLESKMKRQLVSHPDKPSAHYAVIALSWSLDDATVVSLSEDKRISIHNAGTGELVWVHDLWMITTPLKTAAFVFGARQLSIIDIYGSLTLVQLHGKVIGNLLFR